MLKQIGSKEILEKDVQLLIESNLPMLFNLEVVKTKFRIENVEFDTLAYDRENNVPVIIEFKKSFDKSLFDQGLEYLNVLFSRKADFSIALHKKLGISPDPDKISWENAKVVFVSGHYSERQKRAVSFRGLPIELWSFEWMENDFFRLEREKLIKEASLSEFGKAMGNKAPAIEKVRHEIQEYDREFHTKCLAPSVLELFERIESTVKDWGDFEVRYRKLYIGFYGEKSFFVVHLHKSKLQVWFGKKEDAPTFKDIKGVQDFSSYKRNHAFMFEVKSERDLDELFFILKKAFALL